MPERVYGINPDDLPSYEGADAVAQGGGSGGDPYGVNPGDGRESTNPAPSQSAQQGVNAVMMRVGPFKFAMETAAYQKLRRTDAYRWAQQDRLRRLPAQQWVGPDAPTMNLEGSVYPHFSTPSGYVGLGQIEGMRRAARGGTPLEVVDGLGNALGLWCIKQITETDTIFLRGGAPKRQDFTMRLIAFGEDSDDLKSERTSIGVQTGVG